ncbi:alpha/beta hydrolase [Rubrivirga sp.]|uniref:alpha/beta hydrolase n=1 Tax=Rubrivirga sp. TaxID=1885344 RepID=UPI003C706C29
MTESLHAAPPARLDASPSDAPRAALVLCHGRGATPESVASLARAVAPPGLAVIAPRADVIGGVPQWYPTSFLAPLEANEPYLSAALAAVDRSIEAAHALGLSEDHVILGGFSQGACLAVEFAARNARRWGGVATLSGALIGTAEADDPTPSLRGAGGLYPDKRLDYDGDLAQTPVLLACAENDPHIPVARLRASADALRGLEAGVDLRVYPGSLHAIVDDQVVWLRDLAALLSR